MVAELVIVILVLLNAWFGWKKRISQGLLVSALLPAIIGLVAAISISLPNNASGLWAFAVVFVALAGVSLVSLGMAYFGRLFLFREIY